MAGHSQFKNIMFRKGKQDKERSKLFSRLGREITVASKLGLPDPAHNPRLRTAIIAAKAQSMSKDTIDRAIKKGQGGDAENYDESALSGKSMRGIAGDEGAAEWESNRKASRGPLKAQWLADAVAKLDKRNAAKRPTAKVSAATAERAKVKKKVKR